MGNRAIVKPVGKTIGVYLHWNGGRDSVEAFLKYCEMRGFRSFEDSYGLARFCQIVGNFFGGTLSMGVETNVYMTEKCASGLDNGIYEVKGWEIVGRCGEPRFEHNTHKLAEMLKAIDKAQPKSERLGGLLTAKEVPTESLKVGDRVYIWNLEEHPQIFTIVGFGDAGAVRNGQNVEGVPYVDRFDHDGDYSWNIFNYLTAPTYRKARRASK